MGATQRRKGAQGERDLAKLLGELWRVPNVRRAQQSDGAVCGDVIGALPPTWVVECKRHKKPFTKMPATGGYSGLGGQCVITTPLRGLMHDTGKTSWTVPALMKEWCSKAESDQAELAASASCWVRIITGGWVICHRADDQDWMLTTTWQHYTNLRDLLKGHWSTLE